MDLHSVVDLPVIHVHALVHVSYSPLQSVVRTLDSSGIWDSALVGNSWLAMATQEALLFQNYGQ